MTRAMFLSRRTVMRWLSAAGAVLALKLPPSAAAATPIDSVLAAMFPHRDSARIIGRAYLALAPKEASAARLRTLLAPLAEPMAFAARVRTDFTRGDVVMIDGWTLSRTESRACALLALTHV